MKNRIIFWLLFFGVLTASGQTLSPVNVTINLIPPYSTRLSDYANNPGKVLVTLRNTQARAVTVYLRANITGDNGIHVFTNPNFRPSRGITLQPNVPFTLTVGELQEVFDVNQLSTRGITINDIERKNGLPEGIYQVCVRAYDFSRHTVALSAESPLGCTTVRLTRLEPPILIKPLEEEEVSSFQPQNVIFNWTLPAGAPPGTQFRLKIVELFDPKRNPNDAFLSATQPPFFEKTVSGNVYVFGPADPQLVNGRKYAWAVTALDQYREAGGRTGSEGTAFRNGGRSEVRAFTYKQRNATMATPPLAGNSKTIKPVTDYKFDPQMDLSQLMTSVSGKLLYAYPEDYKMENYGKNQVLSKSNFTSKNQTRPGSFGDQYYTTSAYLNPVPGTRPMKKVKVNLVMVYAMKSEDQSLSGLVPTYDAGGGWKILTRLGQTDLVNYTANGKNIENEPLTKVLATGYTNDNGEFNLGFMMKDTAGFVGFKVSKPDKETYMPYYSSPTGKDTTVVEKGDVLSNKILRKTCILVIESPYYCSPFMMINPRPKDNIVLPEMIGLVKSFEMRLMAKNNDEEGQMGGKSTSLENINVELFRRKPMDISLPEGEGQNLPLSSIDALKMGDFSYFYPPEKIARVVAITKTGAENGESFAKIPRVIRIGSKKNDVFIAHTYSDANTGNYNKKDGMKVIDAYSDNGSYTSGFEGEFDDNLEFNSSYKYSKEVFEVVMNSRKPVIKGKVVEKNMGLKGVMVVLVKKKVTQSNNSGSGWMGNVFQNPMENFSTDYQFRTTSADGYFEFKDLEPGDYNLVFTKSGYKEASFPKTGMMKVLNGQLVQTNDIQMIPSGTLLACVTDEDGNKIVADIQVEDGAFYKTSEGSGLFGGCTSFAAPGGKARKIKVFSRSNEHFDGEFTYDIKEEGITTVPSGVLVLLRRKHRVRIQVNGKSGKEVMPLTNAQVTIKNMTVKTDSKGVAVLSFESPGSSFLVKVKPAKEDNFSHWEGEMSIPVTKTPVNREVELSPAREILASVTEMKDGKSDPSKGAKVYVKNLKNGWGNNSTNYTECFTDANGNCTLKGIPVSENNVEVFVSKNPGDENKNPGQMINLNTQPVLPPGGVVVPGAGNTPKSTQEEPSGAYIGEKKEAYWFNGQYQTKVALKLDFKKEFSITDIWGFPVHVELAEVQKDGSYLLSGSLHNLPGNENFGSVDAQNRLDFKKVRFVKAQAGKNNYQPQEDKVELSQKSFPVKIGKGLQGKASVSSLATFTAVGGYPKMYLKKGSDGKGEIRSAVQLELSSFEGAYQLSGKVELGENGNPGDILVFKAAALKKRRLNIGTSIGTSSMGNLKFKVHKFNAEADFKQSYVSGDSVNFYTILHTNIQNVSPADIALKAGYITVLPDKIVPFEGGDEISFGLEKWKVTGQKTGPETVWKYDKNNGGIVIEKAVVNTGIISVNLKNMIIKPDKLIADKLELDSKDAAAFTLGGLVPLEILPGSQTLFSYDPNCYHDNKPHWKLSILSKSGAEVAARVSKLDGMEEGQKLEFGSMNLFSDNQQQLSGPSAKEFTLFKVLKLKLNTIDVGSNFFTLVGQAGMDIPNMTSGGGSIVGNVLYSKNTAGQVKATIRPLFFDVEGKGQVSFHADDDAKSQTIASGLFTSKGTMTVYDQLSGKSFIVKALLKHQRTTTGLNTQIEVTEGKVPLDAKYLDIKSGEASSMKVVSGAWDNLRLTTVLPAGSNGFDMVKDEEKFRTMTLIVKGAIETDPSSGSVGVKGMDTGVGQMTLYYDFNRQEVRGQFLFSPPVPVACGIVNITSGNVSMVVGTSGLYMMVNGTGDIALAGMPLPLTGNFSFMTGYYTKPIYQEDIDILTKLAVQKTLPTEFASGIKGAYVTTTVSSEVLDTGFKYDILDVAVVAAKAYAGIAFEYRTFSNFTSLTSMDIYSGIYGYGGVELSGEASLLGIGAKGGVSFNVQLALTSKASPTVGFSLSSVKKSISSLQLAGCGSVGASFFIGVTTPLKDLGGHVSVDVSANFAVENPTNPKPTLRFALSSCNNGMPVQKL